MSPQTVTILIGVAGLCLAYAKYSYDKRRDMEKTMSDLQRDVAEMKVRTELFWKLMEKQALNILHHPTRHELDDLLERHELRLLNADELRRLSELLTEIIHDEAAPAKEVTLAVMLETMVRAELLKESNGTETDTAMVH